MELRILELGACGELQTPTGLHFGSSKLSIFSFLDLRGTGKMCYNYYRKEKEKRHLQGLPNGLARTCQ